MRPCDVRQGTALSGNFIVEIELFTCSATQEILPVAIRAIAEYRHLLEIAIRLKDANR